MNGGLICNLSKNEAVMPDGYEWKPVLKRERALELKIGERIFFAPRHIAFYAVTESFDDITAEERETAGSEKVAAFSAAAFL